MVSLDVRLGGLSIPYIGFLFALGSAPGAILYKQGRAIPKIYTVTCTKCQATKEMIVGNDPRIFARG